MKGVYEMEIRAGDKIGMQMPLIRNAYPDVSNIVVKVTDSWVKDYIGKEIRFGQDCNAYFFMDCRFSECYGSKSGFLFDNEVKNAIRNHEAYLRLHVKCGGFGDMHHKFRCDNYIDIEVSINYLR